MVQIFTALANFYRTFQDEINIQERRATLSVTRLQSWCERPQSRYPALERIRHILVNSCHQTNKSQRSLNESERHTKEPATVQTQGSTCWFSKMNELCLFILWFDLFYSTYQDRRVIISYFIQISGCGAYLASDVKSYGQMI